jgi:hypothetical protein
MLLSSCAFISPIEAINYNVTITLDSVDALAGAAIRIDGVSYGNNQIVSLSAGTHSVEAVSPANWVLLQWYPGGNLAVSNLINLVTTLTVNGSGVLGADFGPIITFRTSPTDGGTITVNYYGSSPPTSETFSNGQTGAIKAGSSNLIVTPSVGHGFSNWQVSGSITISSPTNPISSWNPTGPGSVTAYFLTYQDLTGSLTVVSAHGNPNPAVGSRTYNSGTFLICNVSSPVTEGNTVWNCVGWSGTGSVPSSGNGNSVNITLTQDSSITWNWVATQRSLNVVSAHGNPNPSVGSRIYASGSSVTCNVTSPVTEAGTVWTCVGWTGTGSVPPSGSALFNGLSTTFIITQNSSITWIWQGSAIQNSLNVVSAHGSPNPSVGVRLFDSGSSVTCSVASPVTENGTIWTCTGWSGTGSVASSGTGTSTTFTITANSSITWRWTSSILRCNLTITSPYGTASPTVGIQTYDYGKSVTCTISSDPIVEENIIWTCVGWTGTGSVPASGDGTSVNFKITQDSSITWLWQSETIKRTLEVNSNYGSPVPSVGSHTYDSGETITCSVSSQVIEGNTVWTCVGWAGTGSVPAAGYSNSATFTILTDSAITWRWDSSQIQYSLSVNSSKGNPNPSNGIKLYTAGSQVTCSVNSPILEGSLNWTCTGWSGTGSVKQTGSQTTCIVTLNQNSSIAWQWISSPIQCKLTIESNGNVKFNKTEVFYAYGSVIIVPVPSPILDGNIKWTCTGWIDPDSVTHSATESSVPLTITSNYQIKWVFESDKKMPDIYAIIAVALVLAAVSIGLIVKLKLPALKSLAKNLENKDKTATRFSTI